MKIQNRRLIRVGSAYGFTVPKAFIDSGHFVKDKMYTIDVEPQEVKKSGEATE